MEDLCRTVSGCTLCELHGGRTKAVCGEGNLRARLVFIGEGPGADEDAQGRPFVGRAGQLLNKVIEAMGLERADVYITNVVKCRPPGNRDPQPVETETCQPFLQGQIELIRPAIVCQLGRIAAGVMMNRPIQIGKVHGQRFIGPGYYNVPVFHPAAALRASSTLDLLRQDFENLKGYLEEDEEPPEPAPAEPEQMGLF